MSNKFLKAADNARRELILVWDWLAPSWTDTSAHIFKNGRVNFQHLPMVTMTPSQLAQSRPLLLRFYMYSVRKHHQRWYLKYIQYSEWVSVPCVEKDPRVALCRVGNVPNMVLQSWSEIRTNVNVCVCCLGILGRPFPPFFFLSSVHPSNLAPCSMATRGARNHEHDNTDSPTTQYTCLLPHNHIPA